MTLLHLVYAMAVGGLVTGAAALLDAGLRGLGRPSRWLWILALVATASAPVWGPRLPRSAAPAPAPAAVVPTTDASVTAAAAPGWSDRLLEAARTPLPALPVSWFVVAGLGVAILATGWVRLERRAARWPRAAVEGEEVSLSPGFGPAVVGLRRPRTVLPRWMLALPPRDLRVVLAHERSHREAGDVHLLAAGLALAALCPWNPWVWTQFRRLRDATEMDCDRRLLAEGLARPTYARVLVSVRLRSAPTRGAVAALVESPTSLERRLKAMNALNWSRPRVALAALAAAGLIAVACETPAPSAVEPETESTFTVTEVTEVPTAGVAAGVAAGVIHAREVERELPFDESTPGAIRLRTPDDAPLIIVDGEAVPFGIAAVGEEVSAENIERIEVIKGEAARAIYGERGASGVVSITTKDGSGEVEFRGSVVHEIREDADPRTPEYEEVVTGTLRRRSPPAGGGN